MKITKSQLVQIIKEEAASFKKELTLKKQLAEIEKQLNEVHAGADMSSTSNSGVHSGQKKPVFKKKGSSLIEIEDEMQDQEAILDALKTIAAACGLTGTIELAGEEESGEEGEEEVDVDVIEPMDDEEGEEEDEEEGEEEDGEEGEEEGEEETETEMEEDMEEGEMEEGRGIVNQEGEMEEGEMEEEGRAIVNQEEEGKMMNESVERKRMMQLAGLKK